MRLDEWMWRNKKRIIDMCADIECSSTGLANVKYRKCTPNLNMAIRIMAYTRGEVRFEDMFSFGDEDELRKWEQKRVEAGFEPFLDRQMRTD